MKRSPYFIVFIKKIVMEKGHSNYGIIICSISLTVHKILVYSISISLLKCDILQKI
jgi:hypothetical protein